MGFLQHRGKTQLGETKKPLSVSDFRGSNKDITQEDINLFLSARNDQIDKNKSGAKSKYNSLLKKSYLKSNKIIKENIKLIWAKKTKQTFVWNK